MSNTSTNTRSISYKCHFYWCNKCCRRDTLLLPMPVTTAAAAATSIKAAATAKVTTNAATTTTTINTSTTSTTATANKTAEKLTPALVPLNCLDRGAVEQ